MAIRGVLFDFDGTLTRAGSLDFAALRARIGCPKAQPVLEFIAGLPSPEARASASRILDDFETEAARRSCPNDGAEDLIADLRRRGLKLGIITRNSTQSVTRAFENFRRASAADFDVILTRDHAHLPKPSPEAVLVAARRFGLQPEEVLMVGDFTFDIEAGRAAGARTVFLTNGTPAAPGAATPDFVVARLAEIRTVLDQLTPLPMGKLPNRLLGPVLEKLDLRDPGLIVGPGVGEDAACVSIDGEEVLVLKSDPITFTADQAGAYAVSVNVNDVATSGAVPRWLLASLLFPPGSCAVEIEKVLSELNDTARRHGLTLCGGHTEITDAVTRPVVAAHVSGTVSRNRLILKQNMREGDRILVTKAIAVEGTCILARDLPDRLLGLGVGTETIKRCQRLLTDPGISIVAEARIAAESRKATAMHDATEGGLATALEEFSAAGRHRIRVYRDRIPVMQETAHICRLLGADPLGLIASGSLLISCGSAACVELQREIGTAGIAATIIGEVLGAGQGIEAVDDFGHIVSWPGFEVDELARVLEGQAANRASRRVW